MQREEGFNTKMADGPDEYESEAGCVPLLHPEVRSGSGRSPRPAVPPARRPRPRGWAAACACGVVERAGVGEAGRQVQARAGCERITGEEIAGRARPGRAPGRRPRLCLEGRGGGADGSPLALRCSPVRWRRGPGAGLEPQLERLVLLQPPRGGGGRRKRVWF